MSRLPYRRALVTGGTGGIGLSIARALRAAGLEVFVCGRDPARVQQALDAVPGLRGVAADVGHAEQRAALVEQAVDALGGLDLLVNNAGIQHAVDWTRVDGGAGDLRMLSREVEVDLLAPLHLTQLALPHLMAAGGAAVVMLTSVLAVTPKAAAPVYCATKAALRSACRSLGAQLGPRGVRVVELMPPLVDTAMTAGRGGEKVPPEQVAEALLDGLIAGRGEVRVGRARKALALYRWMPQRVARAVLALD